MRFGPCHWLSSCHDKDVTAMLAKNISKQYPVEIFSTSATYPRLGRRCSMVWVTDFSEFTCHEDIQWWYTNNVHVTHVHCCQKQNWLEFRRSAPPALYVVFAIAVKSVAWDYRASFLLWTPSSDGLKQAVYKHWTYYNFGMVLQRELLTWLMEFGSDDARK